jgi:hypothetical protein
MKWVKVFILILIILGLSSTALYVIPWAHRIDTTIQGIQCRIGEDKYIENVTVRIKGIYDQYLFKADNFEGSIEISNYDYTQDWQMDRLRFHGNSASIMYHKVSKNGELKVNYLGEIYCTQDMKKLMICIYEENGEGIGWDAGSGVFISAPSIDRDQAIETAKTLTKDWLAEWFQ